jgi:hypothetical protein
MGVRTPETRWAVHTSKRQVINLRSCCIWLVDLFETEIVFGVKKWQIYWRVSCRKVLCIAYCASCPSHAQSMVGKFLTQYLRPSVIVSKVLSYLKTFLGRQEHNLCKRGDPNFIFVLVSKQDSACGRKYNLWSYQDALRAGTKLMELLNILKPTGYVIHQQV